jgi:hypothetical protein
VTILDIRRAQSSPAIRVEHALTLADDVLLRLREVNGHLSVCKGSDTPLDHMYAWWVGQLEGALISLVLAVKDERE